MEDVPPSRKQGSEEASDFLRTRCRHCLKSHPKLEDPMLLKSLGVVPATGKVAEVFCRHSFGGTVVDMDFERGFAVDCVRVWCMFR